MCKVMGVLFGVIMVPFSTPSVVGFWFVVVGVKGLEEKDGSALVRLSIIVSFIFLCPFLLYIFSVF